MHSSGVFPHSLLSASLPSVSPSFTHVLVVLVVLGLTWTRPSTNLPILPILPGAPTFQQLPVRKLYVIPVLAAVSPHLEPNPRFILSFSPLRAVEENDTQFFPALPPTTSAAYSPARSPNPPSHLRSARPPPTPPLLPNPLSVTSTPVPPPRQDPYLRYIRQYHHPFQTRYPQPPSAQPSLLEPLSAITPPAPPPVKIHTQKTSAGLSAP